MDIHEIRLKNFLTLLGEVQERIGSRHGILREFAQITGIPERQVSHLKCGRRNIGSATARKIERAFRLEKDSMDTASDADAVPSSRSEQLFVETALILFRRDPLAAHEALARAMVEMDERSSQRKTAATHISPEVAER